MSTTASKPHNVAVIGYGMSAKIFHIPLIEAVPALRLHSIVQRHPTPDDDAEKDHAGVKGYRSTEEMVKDAEVEVVVVTTVPGTHVELCRVALEAGKHVIVEKPFTPTSQEADELIALAKRQNRLLTVYQNRRWDSDFLTVQSLIHSNTLGRLVEYHSHFDRYRPVAPSGSWKYKPGPASGVIYDLGSHLLDQSLVLFGPPAKITAFIYSQRAPTSSSEAFDDSCTLHLHYPPSPSGPGVLATIKASVISLEAEQPRFWLRGETGSYRKNQLDVQEDQLKEGLRPGKDATFGVEPVGHHGYLTTLENDKPFRRVYPTVEPVTYVEFYRRFADALDGKGEVPVKPEDARNVIRLIELAIESSKAGKTLDVVL